MGLRTYVPHSAEVNATHLVSMARTKWGGPKVFEFRKSCFFKRFGEAVPGGSFRAR
jgi:hypothetical protein